MSHIPHPLHLSVSVEFDQDKGSFVANNREFGLVATANTEAQAVMDLFDIMKAHLGHAIENNIPIETLYYPQLGDRFPRILARATGVFENKEAALEWLRRPQFAFGGMIPIDILETEKGEEEVENLLGRIEHGVYS